MAIRAPDGANKLNSDDQTPHVVFLHHKQSISTTLFEINFPFCFLASRGINFHLWFIRDISIYLFNLPQVVKTSVRRRLQTDADRSDASPLLLALKARDISSESFLIRPI